MSNHKSFEENLVELEQIVKKLEGGQIALEEAISEFQKGMKLSNQLKDSLAKAEKTLVSVMKEDGSIEEMEVAGE